MKIKSKMMVGTLAAALSFCAGAQAVSVPVTNHSFEDDTETYTGDYSFIGVSPRVLNWQVNGAFSSDNLHGAFAFPIPDGMNISAITFVNAAFDQDFNPNPTFITNADPAGYVNQLASIAGQTGSEISQSLSTNFAANTNYTLTVGVGTSFYFPPQLSEFIDPGYYPREDSDSLMTFQIALYYVDDFAVRHILDSTSVTVEQLKALVASPATELSDISLEILAGSLSADAIGKPIGIVLGSLGAGIDDPLDPDNVLEGGFWNVDNVRLEAVAAVPEPTTLAGMLVGVAAMFRRRRAR